MIIRNGQALGSVLHSAAPKAPAASRKSEPVVEKPATRKRGPRKTEAEEGVVEHVEETETVESEPATESVTHSHASK